MFHALLSHIMPVVSVVYASGVIFVAHVYALAINVLHLFNARRSTQEFSRCSDISVQGPFEIRNDQPNVDAFNTATKLLL